MCDFKRMLSAEGSIERYSTCTACKVQESKPRGPIHTVSQLSVIGDWLCHVTLHFHIHCEQTDSCRCNLAQMLFHGTVLGTSTGIAVTSNREQEIRLSQLVLHRSQYVFVITWDIGLHLMKSAVCDGVYDVFSFASLFFSDGLQSDSLAVYLFSGYKLLLDSGGRLVPAQPHLYGFSVRF